MFALAKVTNDGQCTAVVLTGGKDLNEIASAKCIAFINPLGEAVE